MVSALLPGCSSPDVRSLESWRPHREVHSSRASSALIQRAATLCSAIDAYSVYGFDPESYGYSALKTQVFRPVVDTEQLLQQLQVSFRLLVDSAVNGRVDPRSIGSNWADAAKRESIDTAVLFANFLESGSFDFEGLEPRDNRFSKLRKALDDYLRIEAAGGWPLLEKDAPEETIRRRLIITGDFGTTDHSEGELTMREAIAHFQRRHGLQPDGVLGKATLQEMNVPVKDRIAQLRANLERWRWLPRVSEGDYVEVNIPGFQVDAYLSGRLQLRTRAIVGKKSWPTPILQSEISRIVINPPWNVPAKIALREILPAVKRDPTYLSRHHLVVTSVDGTAVPPHQGNRIPSGALSVRLRQLPGPWNSMGRLKFVFQNRFGVYLHGTPLTLLFEERCRDLSHGCVRIEDPLWLSELISKRAGTTIAEIKGRIESGKTVSFDLQPPLPINLSYWTSWVDEAEDLHFAKDIYGGDAALNKTPVQAWRPSRIPLSENSPLSR